MSDSTKVNKLLQIVDACRSEFTKVYEEAKNSLSQKDLKQLKELAVLVISVQEIDHKTAILQKLRQEGAEAIRSTIQNAEDKDAMSAFYRTFSQILDNSEGQVKDALFNSSN